MITFESKFTAAVGNTLHLTAAASAAKKDALAKKYSLERDLLDLLADLDPTPNGLYTDWLAKHYRTGALGELDDPETSEITNTLVVFERLKNSAQFKANNSADINTYAPDELYRVVSASTRQDLSKNEQLREIERERDKYLQEGVEFVGEQDGYAYYEVSEPEAATIMGQGTHWCTKRESHAKGYLEHANLFVITRPGKTIDRGDYAGSDKVAQFFIPENIRRVECQTIEGYDIGEHKDNNEIYVVNGDDRWWTHFEFIAKHDYNTEKHMRNGEILTQEAYYERYDTCEQCSSQFNREGSDAVYDEVNQATYCSLECYKDSYEDDIAAQVEALIPPEDPETMAEKQSELEFLVNSPESPQAEVFDLVREALGRFNERNPENPIKPESVDPTWHLNNLRSAVKSSPGSLEKVFGKPVSQDYFRAALSALSMLIDETREREATVDEAIDFVTSEFDPGDRDVREILIRGGFLPEDPSSPEPPKTSSWKSPLLSKEAASDAKITALSAKYGLDEQLVRDLADEADPTPNGEYLEWLCKSEKANDSFEIDSNAIRELLTQFSRLKRPGTPFRERNSGDINTYTAATLKAAVEATTRQDLSKNEQIREVEREKEKYLMDGCQFLSRRGPLSLYKVTTVEASMIMSKGTHWCTQSESHAANYLGNAPLFVITSDDMGATKNNYNSAGSAYTQPGESDRVLQVYCPNLQYLECQDVDGKELGDKEEDGEEDEVLGYIVTPEVMKLLKWISGWSPELNQLIIRGEIFSKEHLTKDLNAPVWNTKLGAKLVAMSTADYADPNHISTLDHAFNACPEFIYNLFGWSDEEPTVLLEMALDNMGFRTSNMGNVLYMSPENYNVLVAAFDAWNAPQSQKLVSWGYIFSHPSQLNFSRINQDIMFDVTELFKDLMERWKFKDLPSDMQSWFENDYARCGQCGELVIDEGDAVRADDETFCDETCAENYEHAQRNAAIEEDVTEAMEDHLPTEESIAEAKAMADRCISADSAPLEVLKIAIGALLTHGIEVSLASLMANLRPAFNTWVSDEALQKVLPGADREEMQEAWQFIKEVRDETRSREQVLTDAINYVQDHMGYHDTIEGILQNGGFIPEDEPE